MSQAEAEYDWDAWKRDEPPTVDRDVWLAFGSAAASLAYLVGVVVAHMAGAISADSRWIYIVIAILFGIGAITTVAVVWSTRRVNSQTGERAAQLHVEMADLRAEVTDLRESLANLREDLAVVETRLAAEIAAALRALFDHTNGNVIELGVRPNRD